MKTPVNREATAKWCKRGRRLFATLVVVGMLALGGYAGWQLIDGTRAGEIRSWREFPMRIELTGANTRTLLRELPAKEPIDWRYMPARGQWVFETKVDPARFQELLSSRIEAASISRSGTGDSFTIHDPGTLTVGTMDAASGALRLVTWARDGGPVPKSQAIAVSSSPLAPGRMAQNRNF